MSFYPENNECNVKTIHDLIFTTNFDSRLQTRTNMQRHSAAHVALSSAGYSQDEVHEKVSPTIHATLRAGYSHYSQIFTIGEILFCCVQSQYNLCYRVAFELIDEQVIAQVLFD
ncbi:hypothetical protein Droror1_Dr00006809 [Drosera rotundifolia]